MAQIAGFGILSALCVFLLREFRSSGIATLLAAGSAVLLCGVILQRFAAIAKESMPLLAECADWLPFFGKALGIAWLGQISADLCREFGAATLAGYVETLGKAELLLLSLPIFYQAFEAAGALWG